MTHSDFMPELINHEGNIVRIEFGYEPVEVETQPMNEGDEPQTKTEYVGYTVRVEQPLEYGKVVSAIVREKYSADEVEAIILNGDDTELQRWREHAKVVAQTVLDMADAIECAKKEKIADIDVYDKSSAVNGFMYQGAEFWLPRETRVSVMNTANILKAADVAEMTLWLGSVSVKMPVDTVIMMLGALEQYALECYNRTAQHKFNVSNLTSVGDVESYDVTIGYPDKLAF